MTHVRDLTECCQCGAPIPEYLYGRGEWYISTSGGERGPYCTQDCVDAAKEDER